jgi:hypothetical protein
MEGKEDAREERRKKEVGRERREGGREDAANKLFISTYYQCCDFLRSFFLYLY